MCLQRWFCSSLCACECVGVHAVHLSIYMSERLFPQCSRVKYKGEIWHFQESLLQAAALDLLPRTALFWKNHCIVIFLWLLWSPRSPTIASPLALCFLRSPPLPPSSAGLGYARSPPLVTSKHSFPPHLSVSLLSPYTPHKPPTHGAPPPPSSPPWSTYFQLLFMLKKTVV